MGDAGPGPTRFLKSNVLSKKRSSGEPSDISINDALSGCLLLRGKADIVEMTADVCF
jgi:hypothetical protein